MRSIVDDEHYHGQHQRDAYSDDGKKAVCTRREQLDVSAYRCVGVAGRNRQNSSASIIPVVAGCHPTRAFDNAVTLLEFEYQTHQRDFLLQGLNPPCRRLGEILGSIPEGRLFVQL